MGIVASSLGSLTANDAATRLGEDEVDELTVIITAGEVRRLWTLYNTLELDSSGCIRHDEILNIPQLRYNPLGKRLLAATAGKHRAETLSFKDFVLQLSVFAPQTAYEAKLRFAFKVYDFDGDGKIGRDDLSKLLRALVPQEVTEISEEFTQHILDNALREADRDGEGALNYEAFRNTVAHSDIASKLTIIF